MNRRPPSSTPFPYPPLSRSLESLRDSADRDVPVLRLEPLLIGSIFPIHGEDRIIVTPQEVPTLLPAALKAVEDRKFDSHQDRKSTRLNSSHSQISYAGFCLK